MNDFLPGIIALAALAAAFLLAWLSDQQRLQRLPGERHRPMTRHSLAEWTGGASGGAGQENAGSGLRQEEELE